jgi:hypothetical protein
MDFTGWNKGTRELGCGTRLQIRFQNASKKLIYKAINPT